jgi:hypothetical protein
MMRRWLAPLATATWSGVAPLQSWANAREGEANGPESNARRYDWRFRRYDRNRTRWVILKRDEEVCQLRYWGWRAIEVSVGGGWWGRIGRGEVGTTKVKWGVMMCLPTCRVQNCSTVRFPVRSAQGGQLGLRKGSWIKSSKIQLVAQIVPCTRL